jgi:predicted nucleic acid-binding protein
MILVDSSVWIDHLRASDAMLSAELRRGNILCHPFIVGELALGHLRQRNAIVSALQGLPMTPAANDVEMLGFIDRHALHGLGIGYVDAHLLAATFLVPGASFWTRGKRLREVARRLGIGAPIDQ